jgi:hypothetical protein
MTPTVDDYRRFSAAPGVTEHDRREIEAFKRFLALGVRPDEDGRIPREFPGWLPYVEGWGPPPPLGYDAVSLTAWTLPG